VEGIREAKIVGNLPDAAVRLPEPDSSVVHLLQQEVLIGRLAIEAAKQSANVGRSQSALVAQLFEREDPIPMLLDVLTASHV
jgi:hypothetical protein